MASFNTWIGCGIQQVGSGCTCNYIWYGRSFNPPWANLPTLDSISIIGSTSTFDLTNHWTGNESTLSLACVYACNECVEGWMTTCYLMGAYFIQQWTWWVSMNPPLYYYHWTYGWAAIGVKPWYTQEICCNGSDYCAKMCMQGIGYCSKAFTVCCLDVNRLVHLYPPGAMWVENDCLMYVNCVRTLQPLLHDGSTYGCAGVSKAGSIWIPHTGCYIAYVDCAGWKRRTKVGDTCGWYGCDGLPSTPGVIFSGYIWAHDGFQDNAIMFINGEGKQVRIGPGNLLGNSY